MTRIENKEISHSMASPAPNVYWLHVTQFAEAESLALFSKILGEASVVHERAAFVELANLLGHLPLAIDIAACRLAYEPGWAPNFWRTSSRKKVS